MHNKPFNLIHIIRRGIFKWVFQATAAIFLIDMQIQVYIWESVAEFMPTAEESVNKKFDYHSLWQFQPMHLPTSEQKHKKILLERKKFYLKCLSAIITLLAKVTQTLWVLYPPRLGFFYRNAILFNDLSFILYLEIQFSNV